MVECEYTTETTEVIPEPRFNRYMVECELLIQELYFQADFVLIDTWWNVN